MQRRPALRPSTDTAKPRSLLDLVAEACERETTAAFCRRAGFTRQALSYWRNGDRRVGREMYRKMQAALGLTDQQMLDAWRLSERKLLRTRAPFVEA